MAGLASCRQLAEIPGFGQCAAGADAASVSPLIGYDRPGASAVRSWPAAAISDKGVQLGTLRRVVGLETAVPLLVLAVVAIGTGFLAAHLFLRSQLGYSLRPPGVAYYVTVVDGLALSLGVIASTMPLLRRITGPETARNE